MVDYTWADSGFTLLTGATDLDGDPMSVHSVNGSVPGSWPVVVNLTFGTATIYESGNVTFTQADADDNPAQNTTKVFGSFTYRLKDDRGGISSEETCNVELVGAGGGTPPAYVNSGRIAQWKADAGVTLSGSDVTAWADAVTGLSLTAVGAPTVGTAPGGTAGDTIVIGAGAGFTGTPTGFPVDAAPRTAQVIMKMTGTPFFGGFGWGSGVAGQAFTIAFDNGGELTLDYFGSSIGSGLTTQGEWVVATADYDGTTMRLYVGEALIASAAVALTTGSSLINVCRSFGGSTTEAEIGEILVYSRVLSDAERSQNINYLNARFIGSTAVSDPSAPTGGALAETSFTADITANNTFAAINWSARASSTTATESEILAGTGAIDSGIVVANGDGFTQAFITGGVASTPYYVNVIAYGLTGGKSNVVKSASITTTATPGGNPTLSSASLVATGQTTAAGTVSTDVGNGTLRYGLMLNAATTPNATQIKAGTDGDGNPLIGGLRSQAVTATGPQGVNFTGMTEATAYKVAYLHTDASNNDSNIATASATTDAAPVASGSYAADATVTTSTGLYAQLASWDGGNNPPSGKTTADGPWVVEVQNDITGPMTLTGYDFSAITGGVVVRSKGPFGENASYPYNPTSGAYLNGLLTITNNNNLKLALLTVKQLYVANNTAYGNYKVSVHSRWSSTRSVPNVSKGIDIRYCPAALLDQTHVAGFNTAGIVYNGGNSDLVLNENYVEQWADDLYKGEQPTSDVSDRIVIRRCWGGRDNLSQLGAHSDWHQCHSGTQNDRVFYGNMQIEGASLNGIGIQGGDFRSNTASWVNPKVNQNLMAIRGQNGLCGNGSGDCSFNALLYPEYGAHGSVQPSGTLVPLIVGGYTTKTNNIVCRLNSGSADTSGTGGVAMTIGDLYSSARVADLSGYVPYFTGFPGEQTYIDAIMPKVGARTHWNYPGTKLAPYLRLQEIFELGMHPGNAGWPTAAAFHREYDPSNTLGSSWTGTYDDDGNNVVPAPTSLTITEAQLPVYDSDPHGTGTADVTVSGTHNQPGASLTLQVLNDATSAVISSKVITAGAGTAWSGTVNVAPSFTGVKVKVVATANAAVSATQSAGWYAGYIVGNLGQSLANNALTLDWYAGTKTFTPPSNTMWYLTNDTNGTTSNGPVLVTSSSSINQRRFAAAISTFCNGPMLVVDLAVDGTGIDQTVDANETTNRSWVDSMQTPVDYVRTRGSDLSVVLMHWFTNNANVRSWFEKWAAAAFVKQALNGLTQTNDGTGLTEYTAGTVTAGGATNYTPVHFLFDLNGTGQGLFDHTRTRWVPFHGASYFNPQGTDGTIAANDQFKGEFARAQGEAVDGVALSQISLANVPGWTGQKGFAGHMAAPEGTHVSDDSGEFDSDALAAVYIAIAACRSVGALIAKEPRITAVSDAGTHWDVTFDLPHGGNLSTALIEHTAGNYAGSFEATYWITPTLFDEGDLAELHEVAGFSVWTGSTGTFLNFTAAIQDTGTGTVPNRTGTVRVTPTGGTSGKTLRYGYGDGYHIRTVANAKASRIYTHHLIETYPGGNVSGTGYGFPAIRQSGDTVMQTVYP